MGFLKILSELMVNLKRKASTILVLIDQEGKKIVKESIKKQTSLNLILVVNFPSFPMNILNKLKYNDIESIIRNRRTVS